MPFYKRENEELLVAPNSVEGPGFSLYADTHADHTYPVEGWYWFDNLDAAMLGLSASPTSVSPRQIRQALTAGGLRAQVEAAVAASDQDTKDWWEFATAFERGHPMVGAMAAGLGIPDAQIDALFTLAASL